MSRIVVLSKGFVLVNSRTWCCSGLFNKSSEVRYDGDCMADVPDINSNRLSDDDLLSSRLSNTEDNFVERKRFSDDRQWLRTAVAFANSCPIGYPGILSSGFTTTERLNNRRIRSTLGRTYTRRTLHRPAYWTCGLPTIIQTRGQSLPTSPLLSWESAGISWLGCTWLDSPSGCQASHQQRVDGRIFRSCWVSLQPLC